MRKYTHKQVRAKPANGPTVWVDEGMKDFLEALWDRDIDTVLSCQENQPGVAWVEFASPDDAIHFLELVWELADEEMRDRIEGEWDVAGMWDVNANQWHLGDGVFTLSVDLRLPVTDMDRLTELLADDFDQADENNLEGCEAPNESATPLSRDQATVFPTLGP